MHPHCATHGHEFVTHNPREETCWLDMEWTACRYCGRRPCGRTGNGEHRLTRVDATHDRCAPCGAYFLR